MDAEHTGLLVMDVQDGVVQRLGDPEMLERTAAPRPAGRGCA